MEKYCPEPGAASVPAWAPAASSRKCPSGDGGALCSPFPQRGGPEPAPGRLEYPRVGRSVIRGGLVTALSPSLRPVGLAVQSDACPLLTPCWLGSQAAASQGCRLPGLHGAGVAGKRVAGDVPESGASYRGAVLGVLAAGSIWLLVCCPPPLPHPAGRRLPKWGVVGLSSCEVSAWTTGGSQFTHLCTCLGFLTLPGSLDLGAG